MKSRHVWCVDILPRLAVPGTLDNVLALVAQMQAEGGEALFNPLNTTLRMTGSKDYNSVHVQSYKSYEQGMDATVQTLRQTNMAKLYSALKLGSSAHAYWAALAVSPWGTKPPGDMTIDAFLDDVRRHWTARAMTAIAGT